MKHDGVYVRVLACRFQHAQNSQMTSKKENVDSENSGNVENKSEPLDIYDDSDIETNNEIEQVNNVPQINENNAQKSEDIVAQNSNQVNIVTSIKLPKAIDNIEYLNPDSNNFRKALTIGRAGKTT